MNKRRMVGIVAVAIAMLFAITSASPVMAQDVSAVVEKIDKDMAGLIEATEIIHKETDAIIGVEGMPDEVAAMAETAHLSTHSLEFIGVYMESSIGKLDTYKAEPDKNREKMLVTVGKIEALRKLYQDTIDSSDFVTTMRLPVTGKSPDDLIHLLIENHEVQASPEAISAAGDVHNAVHDLGDAAKSMKLNLEELEDTLAEAPAPVSKELGSEIAESVGNIGKNMVELKGAAEVIHEETKVIISGVEGMPDEMKATAKTVHLSSHALKHIEVYMGNYIGKLDTYKAEPEKNKAKMLVTAGKIEALLRVYKDITGASEFVTTMELPVTGKSPYDLVHLLMENPEVQASPEAISAAGDVHNAVHDLGDAAQAMRLNLEELEDALAELGEPTAAAAPTSTSTSEAPGFGAAFAITGILAVAYLFFWRK